MRANMFTLVCVMLILSLTAGAQQTSENYSESMEMPQLVLPDVVVSPGEDFSVELLANDLADVETLSLTITFSRYVVENQGSSVSGGIFDNDDYQSTITDYDQGRIRMSFIATGTDYFSGSGVVGTIPFIAQEDGYTELTITQFEVNGESYLDYVENGSVEISICEDPVADAGEDAAICEGNDMLLNGTAENYSEILWETDGDGVFADAAALETTYTPGAEDILNGNVNLCLTAYAQGICEDVTDCMELTINPLPEVTCPEDMMICADEAAFVLEGAAPEGGLYSGIGVEEGIFDPAATGAGSFEISYTYTNENGCINSCIFMISVNDLPVVTCPEEFFVCESEESFELTGALPEGGVYYDAEGIAVTVFDPAVGAGTYGFSYVYTDPETGCQNSCGFDITVNSLPDLTSVDLVITEDGTTWEQVSGGLDEGYALCLNTETEGYLLNIADLAATEYLMQGYYGFYLATTPAGFFEYWDNRGVNENAATGTWQAQMWQIINGNEPMFYVKIDEVDFMLVDGLQLDFAGVETFLAIPGNYPIGNYTFEGTVQDMNGCVSEIETVTMDINSEPLITMQPQDVAEAFGGTVTLSVLSPNAETYQWYGPQGLIEGAVEAELVIENLTRTDAGNYMADLTNACGMTSSEAAFVEVLPWQQVLTLDNAVNGISTHLDLVDCELENVVAPIMEDLAAVEFMSMIYTPGGTSFCWDESKGAKFHMLEGQYPAQLVVSGYPDLGTEVELAAGWSLMPVWSMETVSSADIFEPLGDNLIFARSVETNDMYWPSAGVYSLTQLIPGKAYLVKLNEPATVNFDVQPARNLAAAVMPSAPSIWPRLTITGDAHSMSLAASATEVLVEGDYLGVFDASGNLCGLTVFANAEVAVNVFGNQNTSALTFKAFNPQTGTESIMVPEWNEQFDRADRFTANGLTIIEGFKAGQVSVNEITAENSTIYPNPASDILNVSSAKAIEKVSVMSLTGQIVMEQPAHANSISLNISELRNGFYLVKVTLTDGSFETHTIGVK